MLSYAYPYIRFSAADAWIGFKPVLIIMPLYFIVSKMYKEQHFKDQKATARNFLEMEKNRSVVVYIGISMLALLLYWLSPATGSSDVILVKIAERYLLYESLLSIAILGMLLFTICRKHAQPTWQHIRILDRIFCLSVVGTIFSTLLARQVTTVRIADLHCSGVLGWAANFAWLIILVSICRQIELWWMNFQPDAGAAVRSSGFQPVESFEQLFPQRQQLAEEIADIILKHDINDPLSICIAGPWGVGKTSVVNGAIDRLKQKSSTSQYECLYVHAMELDTLASLFSYVFSRIRAILKKHGAYVGIGSEYRKFITSAVGKITDASIATLLESRLFPSSDDYRTQMKDLEICISTVMKENKILVIVDDVERCEAKKAQQFIFFIKEIATMHNCIAIFLTDYEYLRKNLSSNMEKDEDEHRRKEYFFYEKFFNCRIDIPPVTFEDAVGKLETEVGEQARKLMMRTPSDLFLNFERELKQQATRYREQAEVKREKKEQEHLLNCSDGLDQLCELLRNNISLPRVLVKYYYEMEKSYSRLSEKYTENGVLKKEISRFLTWIRFDEILFLLVYTEVCFPYEAFCLKEQGISYLQHLSDTASTTRKLIKKMGEDVLYSSIHIYNREDNAYRYSEAIRFTDAYMRRDMPKEVGKFSSRDELWVDAIESHNEKLIIDNWAKMVQMIAQNYAWREPEKGEKYLGVLFSFARERFLQSTEGIDRIFSIFDESQRNADVFSAHIAVMKIFQKELGDALHGCSQKNVELLEQFSRGYLWKRTDSVSGAAFFIAPAEYTGNQQFQLRMHTINESVLSGVEPTCALKKLMKELCDMVPSIELPPSDNIFQQLRSLADMEEKYMVSNDLIQYDDIKDRLHLLRTAIDDMESLTLLMQEVKDHAIPTGTFTPNIDMQDIDTTIQRFRDAINSPDASRDTSLKANLQELFNQIRYGKVTLNKRQHDELQSLITESQDLYGYASYNRKILAEHLDRDKESALPKETIEGSISGEE